MGGSRRPGALCGRPVTPVTISKKKLGIAVHSGYRFRNGSDKVSPYYRGRLKSRYHAGTPDGETHGEREALATGFVGTTEFPG